jgi:hypothetical protein
MLLLLHLYLLRLLVAVLVQLLSFQHYRTMSDSSGLVVFPCQNW